MRRGGGDRTLCFAGGRLRLIAVILGFAAIFAAAQPARGEYFVLRSGQRLNVTGYQLIGETYKLQLQGGSAEIAATDVVAIEPEEVFTSSPAGAASASPYGELIRAAAARYAVDADLVTSVIAAESNFDPKAVSRKNARGLMQLLPETARRLGVRNIFDPKENIDAGTRYLSQLLQRYDNNLALALAAYNAGPDRVRQYGRVPPYRETVVYVKRIQREYSRRKAAQPAAPRAKGS